MRGLWTLLRITTIAIGVAAILFAIDRWAEFTSLPPSSITRRCGNCILSGAIVPLEIGATGLLIVLSAALRIQYGRQHMVELVAVPMGIFSTPYIVGAPVFVVGFVLLALQVLRRLLRREPS